MKTITLEEFHRMLLDQKVPKEHLAFVCPMCGTVQSATSLIRAGAGNTFEDAEKYLGFSCVGRWTHAQPPPEKPVEINDRGCNWTLGGLFQTHELEVINPDGVRQKTFKPATPDQAQYLHGWNQFEVTKRRE